jgi:hypothetical protein
VECVPHMQWNGTVSLKSPSEKHISPRNCEKNIRQIPMQGHPIIDRTRRASNFSGLGWGWGGDSSA